MGSWVHPHRASPSAGHPTRRHSHRPQPFGPIKTSSFRARDRQRPMWRASLPIAKHFCWTRQGKLLPVNFWLKMKKPLKTFFLAIVEGFETVLKLCLRRRGDLGRRCYAPWRPGGRTRPFAPNPRQGKGVNRYIPDTRTIRQWQMHTPDTLPMRTRYVYDTYWCFWMSQSSYRKSRYIVRN